MTPFPFCMLTVVAIFYTQSVEAASTYNMPLIEQTMEIIGKDAVKEVTSMIMRAYSYLEAFSDSGTFSLSSLNLTSDTTSNLTTSAALQYLKDTVDEDYAKAVAYALVNVAAQKAFQALSSLDLFD